MGDCQPASSFIPSCTARSSCGSWPRIISAGVSSTSMSGGVPSFSTAHCPSVLKKAGRGAVWVPLSSSRSVPVATSPPQVRVPTRGPILSFRNM